MSIPQFLFGLILWAQPRVGCEPFYVLGDHGFYSPIIYEVL